MTFASIPRRLAVIAMLLPVAWIAGVVIVVPVAALIDSERCERLEPHESFG